MPNAIRGTSHRKNTTGSTDGSPGTVPANPPPHGLQGVLSGLKKMEQAHVKMARDWGQDLLTTSRMLASGIDARNWLQAPATLAGTGLRHLLTAQAATLSAWSDMQSAALEQVRASLDLAQRTAGSVRPSGAAREEASLGMAWVEDLVRTPVRFAAAVGAAWAPQEADASVRP
jgi:hypothetical protein